MHLLSQLISFVGELPTCPLATPTKAGRRSDHIWKKATDTKGGRNINTIPYEILTNTSERVKPGILCGVDLIFYPHPKLFFKSR